MLKKKDYSGQFTAEMIQAERQRISELSDDPTAVVGMTRNIPRNRVSKKLTVYSAMALTSGYQLFD